MAELDKMCNSCGLCLKLAEFSKNKNAADGYQGTCKSCFREYQISYRDRREHRIARYPTKRLKMGELSPLAKWYLKECRAECRCKFCLAVRRDKAKQIKLECAARLASESVGA